nr:alpha/beta fold hydrolase [Jeotgalicoccus pinnipedialis]
MPSRVLYHSYNDIETFSSIEDNKIKFKHSYLLDNKLPTYFYHDNKNENTIIFIHGGPKSSYLPYYNIIIKYFLNLGFNIYLPNYPGSLGYGIEYEKMLDKKGGNIEIRYLKNLIKMLDGNIYLYGESYGGYLALLLSLQPDLDIYKTFVVNGFTDINYQFIFSKARKLMDLFFSIENNKKFNPINLIDFREINCEVVFIHAKKDYICNINQIRMFIDKYKKNYGVLLKLYCLEKISHQLEEYDQQLLVLNSIEKEVN